MANLDVNDHLVVVGNFGLHQWVCLLFNGLLVCIFSMQMFVTVFTHATPSYRCATPFLFNSTFDDACTINHNSSEVTVNCKTFEYDTSIFTSTVATEFDVVCDAAKYITIVNIFWMVSEGFGSILGSYICDRFGRKPMIIVTYITIGIFGTACTFSTSLIMYTILRCAMALVCFAGFSASISLVSESISPNKRAHGLNAVDLFWAVGSASLSLWGYLLRDWKHLQLLISVPALPIGILCIWTLDESPHWLATNGKKQQAIDVLNKMARWNKVVAPQLEREHCGLLSEKDSDASVEESGQKDNCCKFWKNSRVVIRFFVFSAGWVSCAFCYYALSFGVGHLPGNLYLNNFIMCAVEIFAYICCFCIAWWGRKWPTVGAYLGGGISLLIAILLMKFSPPDSVGVTILSFLGKFFISAAWQIILVWQTEVYPTTHRCTLSVLNGVVGRIGLVSAPYMIDMHKYIDVPNEEYILPSLYVVLMISVGLLHIIPPETNNRKLPETLEEANARVFPMAKDGKDFNQVEDNKLLPDVAMKT